MGDETGSCMRRLSPSPSSCATPWGRAEIVRLPGSDEPLSHRQHCGGCARLDLQLAEDVLDVPHHRAMADVELITDLAVGLPLDEQPQDVHFSRCQPSRSIGCSHWARQYCRTGVEKTGCFGE